MAEKENQPKKKTHEKTQARFKSLINKIENQWRNESLNSFKIKCKKITSSIINH